MAAVTTSAIEATRTGGRRRRKLIEDAVLLVIAGISVD
jgi:hypothetical protein